MPTPSSSPLPPATDGVPSSSPHPLAHSISSSPVPCSPSSPLPPDDNHYSPCSPSSHLPPDDNHYSPPPRAQVDRTVAASNTSSDLNQPQNKPSSDITSCRPTSDSADCPLSPSRPSSLSPTHPPPLSPSHRPTNHDRTAPSSSAVAGSLDIQLSIFSNWGHPTHLGLTEVSYCLTRHHVSSYCGLARSQPLSLLCFILRLRGWEQD